MNIISLLVSFGLLIVAMTIHEFAHGWTAYKLGDTTAKFSGRLTLNPIAHIDLFGTIILPLVLFISTGGRFVFGAAKPVPINFWAFKNPRRDIVLVGASGPASNILLAIAIAVLIKVVPLPLILNMLLGQLAVISVVLGIFNLIPIPPLDGSRILMGILPEELASRYASIEPYGFIIIMVLIAMGLLNAIIWPIINSVLSILSLY